MCCFRCFSMTSSGLGCLAFSSGISCTPVDFVGLALYHQQQHLHALSRPFLSSLPAPRVFSVTVVACTGATICLAARQCLSTWQSRMSWFRHKECNKMSEEARVRRALATS